MSETSKFIPEEAVKSPSSRRKKSSFKSGEEISAALAEASKAIEAEKAKKEEKESNKIKSKEMEEDFDKRISDYKYKQIMTELRGKLKNREEEKKAAEPYETFEVSSEEEIPPLVKEKKRVTNKNVIRRAPKEKEVNVETEDIVSEESVEKESAPRQYESNRQTKEAIAASRAEEAQAAYVKAYREYDPRFTKNKSDDLIAASKPPFLAFGSAAKELKKLHGVMIKALENMGEEEGVENIRKNRGKIIEGFKEEKRELAFKPLVEAYKQSAKEEEERFIEKNKGLAPTEEEKEEGVSAKKAIEKSSQIRENSKEMLSKALLQAYKEMGAKVTADNEAMYLIKAPPFSYIFSAKGRKVRDLYNRYVGKLK